MWRYLKRKECRRIWNSANTLIEEAGLPQIGKWETTLSESSWMEAMRAAQQARRDAILQMKDLRWQDVKLTLVDENRLQARIESWCTATETSLQKKVMKGVCQSNYALERFKSEILSPLTDAYNQWEAFLDQPDHEQHQEESSSVATKIVEVDGSD